MEWRGLDKDENPSTPQPELDFVIKKNILNAYFRLGKESKDLSPVWKTPHRNKPHRVRAPCRG